MYKVMELADIKTKNFHKFMKILYKKKVFNFSFINLFFK